MEIPFGKFKTVFSVDLRSLAVFRICLGLLLLVDLALRMRLLNILFTDHGFLPKQALLDIYGSSLKWTSLHYHSGNSAWLQGVMLFIAAIFATALICGYKTRLATVLSWILFISLNRRVPAICYGFDDVMRLMLLWSVFLPLGRNWSIDSRRQQATDVTNTRRFFSPATVAILLQVCYVYWFTAIWKIHPHWLQGEAIRYAFEIDYTTRPLGLWFADKPFVTVPLTYATILGEFFIPVLALSPWRNSICRWIAILSMWALHGGIWICLHIGLFPPVAIAYWTLFIPTSFWEWVARRAKSEAPQPMTFLQSQNWFESSRIVTLAIAVLLILATSYNILGLPQITRLGVKSPAMFTQACQLLRIDQKWSLYAPTPRTTDGWFAMPAQLADGSVFDVWQDLPATMAKPTNVAGTFRDFRISMLFMHSILKRNNPLWPSVARYMVRTWNSNHPMERKIQRIQIVFIWEEEHNQPAQRIPLLEYDVASGQMVHLDGKVP